VLQALGLRLERAATAHHISQPTGEPNAARPHSHSNSRTSHGVSARHHPGQALFAKKSGAPSSRAELRVQICRTIRRTLLKQSHANDKYTPEKYPQAMIRAKRDDMKVPHPDPGQTSPTRTESGWDAASCNCARTYTAAMAHHAGAAQEHAQQDLGT